LREMVRVAKPGAIVAVRDSDFAAMAWYPESKGLSDWSALHERVVRSDGVEPTAGCWLHVWARLAGIDTTGITTTASTWCYHTPEERSWWSGLCAERTVATTFTPSAVSGGYVTAQELVCIAHA
ncbi:hypothetical protein JB92DRAFT_2947214, partial [Gautieria morchelliformis]